MIAPLLRGAAVVIAVLAVVDPALPRDGARATVSLVRADGDSAATDDLAARVRRALPRAHLVDGALDGADATIVVGTPAPSTLRSLSMPAIVVTPRAPGATLVAVRAPRAALLGETIDIGATVHLAGAEGARVGANDSLRVTLLDGETIVSRTAMPRTAMARTGRDTAVRVSLPYIAARTGVARLRLAVSTDGTRAGATADIGVAIDSVKRRVLVHEPRPAWTTTFVRRALEEDPRFDVVSRTVTARGIAAATGGAPGTLSDARALRRFDVVVVGAPDAITPGEGAALADFARGGGAVLLLLEGPTAGGATPLAGSGWSERRSPRPVRLEAGTTSSGSAAGADSTPALRGSIAVVPSGARASVESLVAAPGDGAPVVWRRWTGEGSVVVSGAVDAWRHRDPLQSRFATFWRSTVADMASYSAENTALVLERSAVGTGARVRGSRRFRAGPDMGGSDSLVLRGWIEPVAGSRPDGSPSEGRPAGADRIPIRVWPGESVREAWFAADAPSSAGRYRVTVVRTGSALDSDSASAEFLVADGAAPFEAPNAPLAAAWARAMGGAAIDESEIATLPALLARTVTGLPRGTWHPMRSPLWIIPFALLLAGEWYLRRRRAQR